MIQKKILILTASPDNLTKLHTNQEITAIETEKERSKYKDDFEIIPKLAVKPDDLDHVLRTVEPKIIHFCGHGEEEGLVLENNAQKSHVVPLEALADLISKFKNTECVVLNACYSDTQAEKLKENVQYVIGMKKEIGDEAAIKFATHFYGALFAGYNHKDAYDFGRIALRILRIEEDLLPVFLEKSQPPMTRRTSANPPTLFHYNNLISAFKDGRAIPFLGPGINFCKGRPINNSEIISDIQLVDYLAQDLGLAPKDLVAAPCPVCLVGAKELPNDCPIKKVSLEGRTKAYSLAKEQALAVAQQNLKYLAQYIKLTSGLSRVYQKLQTLFEKKYDTNELHQFFANLPGEMEAKGYKKLPYQLLVTTNYDDMLERAFEEAKQPYALVFYVVEGEETQGQFKYKKPFEENISSIDSDQEVLNDNYPVILKLYGELQNFVITEDHHINYLVHRDIEQLLPKDILEILWKSDNNFIFMGYSPIDRNLRLILNRLWGEREIGKKSWMIHQSNPGALDREFWIQRKVEILNSDLEEYITELNRRIEILPKNSPYNHWS